MVAAIHHSLARARRAWRRPCMVAAGTVLLVVLLLVWPLACTTRVTPPADPEEPVPVHLLDHGYTATLVLPGPEGGSDSSTPALRRYAFGDWRYYAEGRASLLNGARALLWPTRGAFGRAELQGPAEPDAIRSQVPIGIEHIYRFDVEREDAARLVRRLDRRHSEPSPSRVHNPGVELTFVEHARAYWYFYNSNHMIAAWLEQLGCEVSGPAYVSRWRIESD